MPKQSSFIAIDLKSFYASVECVERGLNPLTTNLVVADKSRTDKTICLAVSPSLKALGLPGRPRLFEVVQHMRAINQERLYKTADRRFNGSSTSSIELEAHPDWRIDYITAVPHMSHYIQCSAKIYGIYLNYIAPEDIHVYSIDEVFIDATSYLATYKMTAHQLAMTIIRDVLRETGITATAGIGTNLYLCKVAMDIVAKHVDADADGVRIAELDENSYRRQLWDYKPITKFWRVGGGIASTLARYGIDTMGKLARCSVKNEELLYKLFGVNAELLIDHAWGWEPCTMAAIKAYKPLSTSLSQGQVLQCGYNYDKALVVISEMADALALDLVDKQLLTCQITITIGYDAESFRDPVIREQYKGMVGLDHYGRPVPKHAHGTIGLSRFTSSARLIINAAKQLFGSIVNHNLLVRRLNITACNLVGEDLINSRPKQPVQLSLFDDYRLLQAKRKKEDDALAREKQMQQATLSIKKKYGKNALLRGLDFADGATARERNQQIGGHKA